MSFSSQRAIYYVIDQFNVYLLIVYIKVPAVHKRQRFDDSESKTIAPRKRQQFNKYDNEEGQALDENESEFEGDKYVFFPPLAFLLLPQKESNRPSNSGKRTKRLTHLVCISKNC